MKRRTLVIRIGDHWFLRHFSDLYEGLTSRYKTKDEPRGILSMFPKDAPSPFWSREKVVDDEPKYGCYLKDAESKKAFTKELEPDAELKIYIAGHCSPGSDVLHSLEESDSLYFNITVEDVAKKLDHIFSQIKVIPSVTNPVKISLISCYAATSHGDKSAFAVRLLIELHKRGYEHLLIVAREKDVAAPFFGKKYSVGKVIHFYSANDSLYAIEKNNDIYRIALKVFKKCREHTQVDTKKDFLDECIKKIGEIGYTTEKEKITELKQLVEDASKDNRVKEYRNGTGWFMRLFKIPSSSEKSLCQLKNQLAGLDKTYIG